MAKQRSRTFVARSQTAVHVATPSHAASPLPWRSHWLGSASSLLREEALYPRRQWHPSVAARSSRPIGRDRASRRQVIQLPPHNSVPNESLGRQLSAHGTARGHRALLRDHVPPGLPRIQTSIEASGFTTSRRAARPTTRAIPAPYDGHCEVRMATPDEGASDRGWRVSGVRWPTGRRAWRPHIACRSCVSGVACANQAFSNTLIADYRLTEASSSLDRSPACQSRRAVRRARQHARPARCEGPSRGSSSSECSWGRSTPSALQSDLRQQQLAAASASTRSS